MLHFNYMIRSGVMLIHSLVNEPMLYMTINFVNCCVLSQSIACGTPVYVRSLHVLTPEVRYKSGT